MTDIIESPKKNVILDATVLTSLMNCARFTDLRFNHNLVSIKGKSNSLEVGSVVHKYMEIYYLSLIKGLDKTKAHAFGMTAAEMYVRGCPSCTNFIPTDLIPSPICGHRINDFPGVENTPIENEGYLIGWKWALETCDQYYNHYLNDSWVPLEVETVKSKVLYEDDEIRVLWKAKLDLTADTNQAILPIDHKTMKQNRQSVKLNNQFMGQCLVMGTRNMVVNKIGFQKTLEPKDKFTRSIMSYSADALTEWYSEILPFYAKLLLMYTEAEHFPPNFSNCDGKFGQCVFKNVCEADRGMREEEIKNTFIVGPEWNPSNDDSGE